MSSYFGVDIIWGAKIDSEYTKFRCTWSKELRCRVLDDYQLLLDGRDISPSYAYVGMILHRIDQYVEYNSVMLPTDFSKSETDRLVTFLEEKGIPYHAIGLFAVPHWS